MEKNVGCDTFVTDATQNVEDLISTKDAAEILGVSTSTLKNWRERKLFGVPFFTADVKRGQDWYYYRERILQLKEIYQKGTLQSMYKLARKFKGVESSDNFQIGDSSRNIYKIEPKFYPADEVAKILNVTEMQLSRWRESRKFPEDMIDHEGTFWYSAERVKNFSKTYRAENSDLFGKKIPYANDKGFPFPEDFSTGKKKTATNIPYDADIELELIGSLLLKNGLAIPTAAKILTPEDFYKPEHKILFRAILNIFNRATVPSLLSLVEELRKIDALDRVGYSYVLSLGQVAFTTAYVENHAKIIKDKSVRRQVIKLAEKLQNDAANPAIETTNILSNGESALRNVSDNSAPSTLITPEYYFSQRITRDIAKNKIYANRKTGFKNIDSQQIFSPGLYVIGATPAAGKTTFCWQLLEQLADNGETCIFCSYEMSALELYSKTLSKRLFLLDKSSTLTASEIRRGGYSDALEGLLIEFANTKNLQGVNLFEFRDETVDDMLRVIKPYCTDKEKSPVVCLDYLQIIPSIVTDSYSSNRARVDDIVHKLKTFQRETNTTFIVVSSFNRTNYAQQVSFESFKESGNIEYTADVVWAMQLNVVNELKGDNISDARKKIDDAKKSQPRKVQLKCLKNRQGQNYDCYFNYYSTHDYFEACDDLNAVEKSYSNIVPKEF